MEDDEQIAESIKARCHTGDVEVDHDTADYILVALLRRLGYEKTVTAWEAVEKWYA